MSLSEQDVADFQLPWEEQKSENVGPVAQSKGGPPAPARARRSSILKQSSGVPLQSGSSRGALQDLNPNSCSPTKSKSSDNPGEHKKTKLNRRRSSKRVSFSTNNLIKEFQVGSQTLTIWNSTYEKETSHNASSGTETSSTATSQQAEDPQEGQGRKRPFPNSQDESSSNKKAPPQITSPTKAPHAFLPWSKPGPEGQMLVCSQEGKSLDLIFKDSVAAGEISVDDLTADSNNSFLKMIAGAGNKGNQSIFLF